VSVSLPRRSLLAGGTALAAAPAAAQVGGWRVGIPASDFAFRDAAGRRFTLASFPDRALLLLFWATWSRDSDAELIKLDAVAQTWREDPRVAFLTLVIAEPVARAKGWLERRRLTLPVYEPEAEAVWDLKFLDGRTARLTNAVPYGAILDTQRSIRFLRQGAGGAVAYDEQLRRVTASMIRVG